MSKKNQDQPTIPGTATEQEAALEEALDEIIDRREKIKTSRAALTDAREQAFTLMRKLGKKEVTREGFMFRRETEEKLRIAAIKEEIDTQADGSQDADGYAPASKASKKAAV